MNNSSTDQIKSNEQPAPKKSHFWKWFWGVTIVLVGLSFWAIGSQFLTVPLRISNETTFIIEPLRADGESVDYIAYADQIFCSDLIATESNGYRNVIRRFGMSGMRIEDSAQFKAICERLKIASGEIESDLTFEDPYAYSIRIVKENDFDVDFAKQMAIQKLGEKEANDIFGLRFFDHGRVIEMLENSYSQPWTNADLPMMIDWLERNAAALDFFTELTKLDAFEIPIVRSSADQSLSSNRYHESGFLRNVARGLVARANFHIGNGDFDSAIEDVSTLRWLGRRLRNDGCSSHQLCGLVLENYANSVGICSAPSQQPSRAQLQELIHRIDDSPQLRPIGDFGLARRLNTLCWVRDLSNGGIDDWKSFENVELITQLGIDWNVISKRVNQEFNSNESLENRFIETRMQWSDYVSINRRSNHLANFLLPTFFDSLASVIDASYRTDAQEQLRKISLAMLLYEKDHGTLPPAFTADENGKPLHSWRTLLLPYLGEQEIFRQIRFREPWDSPHNRQVSKRDLQIYCAPDCTVASPGDTYYSVVVGPDFAFSGSSGRKLGQFGSTSDNLILVVERNNPVCWMDPSNELSVDDAKKGFLISSNMKSTSEDRVGGRHEYCAVVGLRNGAAIPINSATTTSQLLEMLKGTYRGSIY